MKALIIANGTPPSRFLVRRLASAADIVVCADGGANHARPMRITPDIIVGDMDSITPSTKRQFHRVPTMLVDDQDSTDLEKTIQLCIDMMCTSVDIVGATGDRLDHTTGTLGCFKKFGKKVRLQLFDTVGVVSMIEKKIAFASTVGEIVSLIPLERCEGVTTHNLKYALQNESLELGVREGISNETTGRRVTISVKRGTLLLYRFRRVRNKTK
ncbi:MAG: thiamine diphosphokinase [Bacteroidota bacterium]|jgi:thiamine pyrophosphokinase